MIINVGASHPRQVWPQWIWAQFFIHCGLVFLIFSGQPLKDGSRRAALPALDAHASARSLHKAAEKLQHGSIRRDSPYPAHEPESREPCAEELRAYRIDGTSVVQLHT